MTRLDATLTCHMRSNVFGTSTKVVHVRLNLMRLVHTASTSSALVRPRCVQITGTAVRGGEKDQSDMLNFDSQRLLVAPKASVCGCARIWQPAAPCQALL